MLALGITIALMSPAMAQDVSPTRDEQTAIAWLHAAATPFNDTTPSTSEFDPLLPHFDGAQVVGIGEATHGGHEDQAFKAELIRKLIESGRIDILALECNRRAAAGFDEYVTTGKGDPVALIRGNGFFPIWRDDEFAGLIIWIRAWNTASAKPVHIIGIDMQESGADIGFALDFIRKHDPALARKLSVAVKPAVDGGNAQGFYNWLRMTTPAIYHAVATGIDVVVAAIEDHHDTWSKAPGFAAARYAARVAAQGMKVFELEGGIAKPDYSKFTDEYWNQRDKLMAANLVELVGTTNHAALWAHDMHVLSELDSESVAHHQVSTGSELRQLLKSRYVSVGFAWTQGSFNARLTLPDGGAIESYGELVPRTLPNDRPGDLGYVLGKVGLPRFWIDLRHPPENVAAWGKTFYFRGWAGFAVATTQWQNSLDNRTTLLPSHDVLVYFNTISPSHLWKLTPNTHK